MTEFVSTWRGAVGSLLLEAMGLPTELSEGIDDSALYGSIWPPEPERSAEHRLTVRGEPQSVRR